MVDYRKCTVTIKISDGKVQNISGKHMHEPLSNCNIAVIQKIEELKVKMCTDQSLNPRLTYMRMYEDLIKVYDKRELAQYWKDFDGVRAVFYYHRRKNAPKLPNRLDQIKINGEYAKTSDNEQFLR